ncbi:MAG: matrixin family metalloprotease [Pirellulales bacterium]
MRTVPRTGVCVERIVPDDLDPGKAVRHALARAISRDSGGVLDASSVHHVARMAVPSMKRWESGALLRCRFLDGSATMRRKVEEVAHRWEEFANIRFQFVTSGDAEIRISFYADSGSWSAVGNDALLTQYFPSHQPTMNYGWLRDSTDADEYSRVVLHEFGHALGAIHEHQSPSFSRQWNVQKVIEVFSGPPNYWSESAIRHNVLEKYSSQGMIMTLYDPDSIMLYMFSDDLFADGLGATNNNTSLSAMDKSFIQRLYPAN